MQTTLYQQGSQLRCYKCGDPNVKVICHHCGRPMCAQHGPVRPVHFWITENREFEGLSLGSWPLEKTDGAHCEYHVHSNLNYRRLMILPGMIAFIAALVYGFMALNVLGKCLEALPPGFTLGPAGFAEALRDPGIYSGVPTGICYQPELIRRILLLVQWVLVGLAGLGAIAAGWRLNQQNVLDAINERQTEVPFGPDTERVEVVEELHAKLVLEDSGKEKAWLTRPVRGSVHPGFRFTRQDSQRLEEYRRKYPNLKKSDLPFQAGFLVLDGRPQIVLDDQQPQQIQHPQTPETRYRTRRPGFLWLEGMISQHPYFGTEQRRQKSAWELGWQYTVPFNTRDQVSSRQDGQRPWILMRDPQRIWNGVPLRLVPRLQPAAQDETRVHVGGSNRVLKLELQFNPSLFPYLQTTPAPDKAKTLTIDQVLMLDELVLWLDADVLGRPRCEGVISQRTRSLNGLETDVYQVEWRNSLWRTIRSTERSFVLDLPTIEFDRAIPPQAHLQGQLRLRVPATLSGIWRARYFSALGHAVPNEAHDADFPSQQVTYLNVEFDLALRALPMLVREALDFPPIQASGAPTPERVHRLAAALDLERGASPHESGLYVRRVVESVPQIGEQGQDSGRWHWDLTGRYYLDAYPLDFHAVVYGQGDARQGTTRADLSVQGRIYDSNPGEADPFKDSRDRLHRGGDKIYESLKQALLSSDGGSGGEA